MEQEELTPHIEEIKRVLGDKIDDEQLRRELDKYLNEYRVGIDGAKRGIIRKYGGADVTTFVTGNALNKKIGDLTGTETNVDLTAKAVFIESKTVTVKGVEKNILSGIIGDETGTASFTAWDPSRVQIEKGGVYVFKSCYCKTWNDRIQVHMGNRGKVEPANVSIDVPSTMASAEPVEAKVADIKDGMSSVTVTAEIVSLEKRSVLVKGEEKTVYSGMMADDTGKIQFSAWKDYGLEEGKTYRLKNGYIRSWKSIPQFNLGDRCEVEAVSKGFGAVAEGSTKRTVADICRIGGGVDISIEGLVVDIRMGSGLIWRCPQCRRSILDGMCTVHGAVDGIPDLRLKVVIDDGTGAIGAVIASRDTQKLTGIGMKEAEEISSVHGEGAVSRELGTKILMRRVEVVGNVMTDDYGPSIIVKGASLKETDLEKEAEALLKEVEGSL